MRLLSYLRDNGPFLAAGVMLTFLSSFGQTYFISLFAGEIRATFGLSHGAWGSIYMVGTMGSALVMIWAGGLTDLLRVRLLGPLVLGALALACVAMALSPWVVALAFVIFALRLFGQGMCTHIAQVAMARWFVTTRGRALSIASLGFSLGEALVPMAVVAALGFVAWQALWLIGAALCVLAIPVLAWLLSQERTPRALAGESHSLGMQSRHWHRSEVLRHPLFWCMVPAVLGPAAFNTAFFFHQVHLSEIKGLDHLVFVAFFPIYTGVSIVAMIVTGWAIDRFGTARLMPLYQIPMVAAFVWFALADSPGALILGFVCLGVTSGANATLPSAFWAEFFGTAHIGAVKSLAMAVMVLGSAIGPGLTGVLIDLGAGLEAQFVAIAGFFVLTTGLMLFGIGRARRHLPSRDEGLDPGC